MFRIHLRRLLEDTVRCHGPTSVQALRRVVLSQIPPQLCSKATSHALDRLPGSSRVTLIYKLHIRIGTITEITFQPHNARLVHCLDLLQASTSFIASSIQSFHVCRRMMDTVHGEELPGSPIKLLQVRGPPVNDAKTVRENR